MDLLAFAKVTAVQNLKELLKYFKNGWDKNVTDKIKST